MDKEGSASYDEEKFMEGPIDKLYGETYLEVQILSFGKQVQGIIFQLTSSAQVLKLSLDGYCQLKLVKISINHRISTMVTLARKIFDQIDKKKIFVWTRF